MTSYSYSSGCYEGDLCEYSLDPYYESSSFRFHDPVTYSLNGYGEDPGEEYPLPPYQDRCSSVQYQDSFAYGYNSTCYDHEKHPIEDHSLVPYYSRYNSSPCPDSVAYNWNDEFMNRDRVSYYQPEDYPTHDAAASWSRISYSASALSEPKCITLYGESPGDYYSVQTQFLISYNVSDFNEPEYEEYDPTPYGGGYDIAATYGKPLSPSEDTCYPRSDTLPVIPAIVTPPVAKEENPPSHVQSTDEETAVEILPSVDDDARGKPGESGQHEEEEQPEDEKNGNGSGSAYEDNEPIKENGSNDHYEKQVVPHQVPSGYGLEAVDICESLFGPWPCLTRNYRQAYNSLQDQEECGYGNQWNDAADYLFGSSYPYGQTMPPGNDSIHAYHRYNYQENPLHQEVKYVYNSWSG